MLYLYFYEPGAGFIDQRIPAGHRDGSRGLCVPLEPIGFAHTLSAPCPEMHKRGMEATTVSYSN